MATPDTRHAEDFVGIRVIDFQRLMQRKIRDVLLVSSLYDLYLFEEDGRLYEMIRQEFHDLNLSHPPEFVHATTGAEALELIGGNERFDLVIATLHLEDMHAVELARKARAAGYDAPIVLLAYDNKEYDEVARGEDIGVFERVFIWQGDYRLLIAIIECLEDRINVEHDTQTVGVQSIILVEDNVAFYSAYLPSIYGEIVHQSRRLIAEGMNVTHRLLRMRARPKILLATTYEEAWGYFEQFSDHVLGIISDIDFRRSGKHDPRAGIDFARAVKNRFPDIPVLLQSTSPDLEREAHTIGASYLLKTAPTLLHDLRQFMNRYFSFGDFIFRLPDGREIARASDLRSLEEQLRRVPEESIQFHAERNHFSNWLKARTEFDLAFRLRPQKVEDYGSAEELRQDLIASLSEYRHARQRGVITDFTKDAFDPENGFARIGGGSLGGKARGLGFANTLLATYNLGQKFGGVRIFIPTTLVLGTEVFDRFIEENGLQHLALQSTDDAEITRAFLSARKFPRGIRRPLADFLDLVTGPLAIRSSSLLEDSQFHPFAGVYATYMIPNSHPRAEQRLRELLITVRRIFASTYYRGAKDYMKATSFRLEEEKMAVIIQSMVGLEHGSRFYPDISGVGKSYNFYPVGPQHRDDGVVTVALGLGKLIVDGGVALRFCPKYPNHLMQFSSTEETLRNSQSAFYALDLKAPPLGIEETRDLLLKTYSLPEAEEDGPLRYVGSTFDHENDSISDGLSRRGRRVITFAPILRQKIFPLPGIVEQLLSLGSWGMGTPVEIEFAANIEPSGGKGEYGLLQIRPMVMSREAGSLNLDQHSRDELICRSQSVVGHGITDTIRDVVMVDINRFDRSKTAEVAAEVGLINQKLVTEKRPYLLIGVGRWGSLDPWLGIPVRWDQIAGARTIVEAGFADMDVTPSQGSHFFQNITSFMVGYFTITRDPTDSLLDWEWLLSQPVASAQRYTRHLRFESPLVVKIDGKSGSGVILKPDRAT
jgi:CheY-like chemotaxis protein